MSKREGARFSIANVRVDVARRSIDGPRGSFRVEPRVMDVLVALADRAPEPVSRDELIAGVWQGAFVTDGVLTRCISILRGLLGDDRGNPRFIETLAKRGYRLLGPVSFVGAATEAPVSAVAPGVSGPISIAVLPFVYLADGGDEHVADGLTELLTANLAGVSALRVVARTSAMTYKGKRKRLRQIGAELRVDYVIEGSILADGGRLQIVVRLIDARTELHVWTQSYVRDLRGLLALLNEVARAVAVGVRAKLRPAEALRLGRPVAIGESALQHYLKGRFHWAQRSADALARASAEFAACAHEAADFAPAHVGLADVQIVLALYGLAPPVSAAALAREHHARALALDPDSAEVQTALGAVCLFFDWDFEAAERAFVRSLGINPSYTTTHLSYGDLLMMRGDFERGLALIREAVQLSPFDLGLSMNLGDFLIFARCFDEAAAQLEHTLALDERFVPGRLRLAEALALAGRRQEALRQVEFAFACAPEQPRVREVRAFVLATTHRTDEARGELVGLETMRARRYVSAWELARAYAVMGEVNDALRLLSAAVAERAPMTLFAGVHAALDPVRGDQRFPAILDALGLPFGPP